MGFLLNLKSTARTAEAAVIRVGQSYRGALMIFDLQRRAIRSLKGTGHQLHGLFASVGAMTRRYLLWVLLIAVFQFHPSAEAVDGAKTDAPAYPAWPVLPTAQAAAKEAHRAANPDTRIADVAGLAAQIQQSTGKEAVEASRAIGEAESARQVKQQQDAEAATFTAKLNLALQNSKAASGSADSDKLNKEEVVPSGWTYADNKDRIEAGLSDEEREYLREHVKGPQSLLKAQLVLEDRRAMDRVYALGSPTSTFFAKAAARLMDPLVLGALLISGMLFFFYIRGRRSDINKPIGGVMPSAEAVQSASALHEGVQLASTLIVGGYRRKARESGNEQAPTDKTSDKRVMEIYQTVGAAFQQAAMKRGESMHAPYLNYIVLHFLAIEESHGPEFLEKHLRYQTEKYLNEGLRPDYRQELHLF